MSHVFKSGTSVFTTGGSIIKVKDTITSTKQPINIGLNYTQGIEYDTAAQRYYVCSGDKINVYDVAFTLIDSITSIAGIMGMQLDKPNNRLIITERNTPSFKAIDLTSRAVTTIFNMVGVNETVKYGYFDSQLNRFYVGTNQVYVFSATGAAIGIMTDSRLMASSVTAIIRNPYTGLLMICINNKILLADASSLTVQATAISGTGVDSPAYIRFDPINPNSYWICNTNSAYISEMSVGTNAAKRIINLGNSLPLCIWIENTLGLYSIIITDAPWNQFYKIQERLV